MPRRTAALGRAAGIDDPDASVPVELRHVRVPVDNRVAAREPRDEPFFPPRTRARDVDEPDQDIIDLDHSALGKCGLQRGFVHVAVHGLDGRERRQILEHACADEVPRVQDQVGFGQSRQALVRGPPRPARQVRVRDDRDERQRTGSGAPSRKRPARQTNSPSA